MGLGRGRRIGVGKDDFLEEFGDVREEGNFMVVGWISLVFIVLFGMGMM